MTSGALNPTILEPLFAPWAKPNAYRIWAEKAGDREGVSSETPQTVVETYWLGNQSEAMKD